MPEPGAGASPGSRRGLRGLPHRSSRGGRRPHGAAAAGGAGARDRGAHRRRSALASNGSTKASASASPGSAGPAAPVAIARSGRENLCPDARFTGYTLDGGYGDYCIADERYCFPLPGERDDAHSAPLLCAGLIGYRALALAGDAERLGLYGFGAAAHIIAQVARAQGRRVFAFVRPGDRAAIDFARGLGAEWAGASDEAPPEELDAALLFAPVGALVPAALRAIAPGGTVVSAGIHMSDIPAFPYELLWRERSVSSRSPTSRDATARNSWRSPRKTEIEMHIEPMPLDEANTALDRLRAGQLQGAAVLTMD